MRYFSLAADLSFRNASFISSDIMVHGANMGPTWVLSAPDGPHVGPMNLAITFIGSIKTTSMETVSTGVLEKTRWVDGTPTTEVTPVTIWKIHTPDLGHQMVMVMVMVMNDLLPPPLCNVNWSSNSEIQLFQNLTMKIHGQGHVCGQRSSRLTFKFQRSRLWSRSNPLVTFEAWSSIDIFDIRFVEIGSFLAEI